MKQDDIEYRLSQLLDGDLPDAEKLDLQTRLDNDADLAEQQRLYQSLDDALAEWGEQVPPVDWNLQRETIGAALEREALLRPTATAWPGRVFRWGAVVSAAAAAVIVLTLGVQWLTSAREQDSEFAVAWGSLGALSRGAEAVIEVPPAVPTDGRELSVRYVESVGPSEGETGQTGLTVATGRPTTIVVSAGGLGLRRPVESSLWGLDEL